ncbi:DNA repair protein XRCC4-like [Cydia fagiglandana]|uniref:DNA repair protein XRCC4-like n=1 Tax=Cydia fagiglandana TaxID=1458189 RepID=UPI002FEE1730
MDQNERNNAFVTKLYINGQNIYIKVSWKDNENDVFRLKLYEGERTWSGRFSVEFAEEYRQYFDETKPEYLKNVEQSLKGDSDDFTYAFSETGDNEATFVWKKKYIGSTATRIHGSVSLKLDEPESKDVLIDFLLDENKSLQQALSDFNERTNILTGELNKCKQEMEKYVDIKTTLESVLYGKFVQILNTKKRRIELLEENIQKFTQGKNV